MNLVRSRVIELLLPLGMLFSTSSFVRADRAIEPLSALVNKAEIVAIGVVVDIVDGKQRGG